MSDFASNQQQKKNSSRVGNFLLYLTGSTAIVISLFTIPFVSPAFRRICLPYVPATPKQIENILSALKCHSGKVVDLGSGDGRIVFSVADLGYTVTGVELNLWLVLYSRFLVYTKGYRQRQRITFFRRDLWSFQLKPYSNVIIFGVEEMMYEIEKKCLKELTNGSVIITCRFPLCGMKPTTIIGEGVDTVWKYKIQKRNQ